MVPEQAASVFFYILTRGAGKCKNIHKCVWQGISGGKCERCALGGGGGFVSVSPGCLSGHTGVYGC